MIVPTVIYGALLAVGSVVVVVSAGELVLDAWRGRQDSGRELAARLSARQAGRPASDVARARSSNEFDPMALLGAFGVAFFAHLATSAAADHASPEASGEAALIAGVIAAAVQVAAQRHGSSGIRQSAWVRDGWLGYALAVVLGVLGAAAA